MPPVFPRLWYSVWGWGGKSNWSFSMTEENGQTPYSCFCLTRRWAQGLGSIVWAKKVFFRLLSASPYFHLRTILSSLPQRYQWAWPSPEVSELWSCRTSLAVLETLTGATECPVLRTLGLACHFFPSPGLWNLITSVFFVCPPRVQGLLW